MTFSLTNCRRLLLTSAVILIVVAVVVAVVVIPQVRAEVLRGTTPEKAVTAFWVNVGLSFLSGVTLFFVAIRSKGRSWISISIIILAGIVVLILGLALADAASAYKSHGPPMQTATILLFICAVADLLSTVLVVSTAFLQPRKT